MKKRCTKGSFGTVCIFMLFSLLYSCKSNGNDRVCDPGNDSLVLKWKSDSCGCENIRTYDLAANLFLKYKLKSKTKGHIYTILGVPNKTMNFDESIELEYYYNSACNKGIPIDSMLWIVSIYGKDSCGEQKSIP